MKIDLPTKGGSNGGTMWRGPDVAGLWVDPAAPVRKAVATHVHIGYVALTGLIGAIVAIALVAACIANEHTLAEAAGAGHWVRTDNNIDFVYGAK